MSDAERLTTKEPTPARRIRIQIGPIQDGNFVWPALPEVVLASDYDALTAERDRLREALDKVRIAAHAKEQEMALFTIISLCSAALKDQP